jgi:hypothetical protein
MANTGNTQQQINYGAAANDGQGDPLRTAFIKTDDNFDNVWLAGPVGSNITIGNNTIQSNNTNGNIVLKPNGTGVIQANASVIPNADGVRDLGSNSRAWRAAYIDTVTAQVIQTTSISSDDSSQIVINNDTRFTSSIDIDHDLSVGQALYLTPATKSSNSPGIAGEIAVDSNYVYVCVSANTWKRAALSAF